MERGACRPFKQNHLAQYQLVTRRSRHLDWCSVNASRVAAGCLRKATGNVRQTNWESRFRMCLAGLVTLYHLTVAPYLIG